MLDNERDAYLAGRLIQWALQPQIIPYNEPEYRQLVDRCLERPAFRAVVRDVADGLGLVVLDITDRGLFLGTKEGSAFALKPSAFRSSQSADDRLLDGLIQVAIATSVFPKQRDLDDEATDAKPPISVEYVDEQLRELCEGLKQSAVSESDPQSSAVEQGLQEAWRVYDRRPSVSMTAQGRRSLGSTQGLIEKHLEQLVEYGCFTALRQGKGVQYRPTLRYQVLVRELAASELYRRVSELLSEPVVSPAEATDHA